MTDWQVGDRLIIVEDSRLSANMGAIATVTSTANMPKYITVERDESPLRHNQCHGDYYPSCFELFTPTKQETDTMTHKINVITTDVTKAAEEYILASVEQKELQAQFNDLNTRLKKLNSLVNTKASALSAIVRPYFAESKTFLVTLPQGSVVINADYGVQLTQVLAVEEPSSAKEV